MSKSLLKQLLLFVIGVLLLLFTYFLTPKKINLDDISEKKENIIELDQEKVSKNENLENVQNTFENLKYSGQDLKGNTETIEKEGMMSSCLQNEIDHLNGILFVDHLVAHQHLTRPIRENSLESHNHDLDVTVNVKDNDTYERLKTRVELNKVYSDSSLSELQYDLYDAGYLLDRE